MRNGMTDRGTVLIFVLWIALGLTGVALYFGHTMTLDYRAAENSLAGQESRHAIQSAQRYVTSALSMLDEAGTFPDEETSLFENVQVGPGRYWLIGRSEEGLESETLTFGLVDEASRLHLNVATREMLEMLPGMTTDIAAAIIDWRDEDTELSPDGAESEHYLMLDTPYICKDGAFESVEELRLVAEMDLSILYGEDVNRNGALDPNEDDADESEPADNKDGALNPGLVEYLTVYSREPNTTPEGEERININEASEKELRDIFNETFGNQRANEISASLEQHRGNYWSTIEFVFWAGLTNDEFQEIADYLTVHEGDYVYGLVNVNTASKEVLECIPGIGEEYANSIVAYREQNPDDLDSIVWITNVLDEESAIEAGRYITTKSYQFSVDIAAVGQDGRGFRRTLMMIDTADGDPVTLFSRDLSALGWPLGSALREEIASEKNEG